MQVHCAEVPWGECATRSFYRVPANKGLFQKSYAEILYEDLVLRLFAKILRRDFVKRPCTEVLSGDLVHPA